jgi:hypothetical protein
MHKIKTLGELKKNGYVSRSIKDEIRDNLIKKNQGKRKCGYFMIRRFGNPGY